MTALVIGVGQHHRGDDAVGLAVAEEIRRVAVGHEVVTVASPTRLIDLWENRDHVVVVDAIRTTAAAGEVVVVEVGDRPLPARPGAGGSHGFGVAEAVELGRTLGRLPERLVVIGVTAETFTQGTDMTRPVARAVAPAARAVLQALATTVDAGDA